MSSWKKTIVFAGILSIVFTLPYTFPINNIAIIFGLTSFIFLFITSPTERFFILKQVGSNRIALLLIVFSLFYLGSGLSRWNEYSDIMSMWKALEKRLPFFIFPFMLAIIPMFSPRQIKVLLNTFLAMIVLSSLICLVYGAYYTISSGTVRYVNTLYGVIENNFMYYRLGSYIGIHPVYYSSYVLLGLIITLSKVRQNFNHISVSRLFLMLLLPAYFIVLIFLLKSAIIIAALIFVLLGFVSFHLYEKRKHTPGRTIIITGVLLLILLSILAVRIEHKIGARGSLFTYDYAQPGGGEWNVVNLRLAKWTVALEAISDHWLAGVGPSNLRLSLDYYYGLHGFKFALKEHYNPHNQFLHSFLILGIVGVLLVLLIYLLLLVEAYRKLDIIWFLFVLGFTLFSITESTLAVSKGIVFFAFVNCLFSYLPFRTSHYLKNEPGTTK